MRIVCTLLVTLTLFNSQTQKARIKLGANATLFLERSPFRAAGKALKLYSSKQPNTSKSLLTIDGKPVFGIDGEPPKYVLQKAVLLLNGHQYNLRVDGMYNPWFGEGSKYSPNQESARLLKKGNIYRLQAVFSDGAGTYRAEWVVAGGTVTRTKLSADDEYVTDYYSSSRK